MSLAVSRMHPAPQQMKRALHSCRYVHVRSYGTNGVSYQYRHLLYLRMTTGNYRMISSLRERLSANGQASIRFCFLVTGRSAYARDVSVGSLRKSNTYSGQPIPILEPSLHISV